MFNDRRSAVGRECWVEWGWFTAEMRHPARNLA
jgi:hypothetical protein